MEKWSNLEVKIYRDIDAITRAFQKEGYLLLISSVADIHVKHGECDRARAVARFIINDKNAKNVLTPIIGRGREMCLYDRKEQCDFYLSRNNTLQMLLSNGYFAVTALGLGFEQSDKLYVDQLKRQINALIK